MRNPEQVIAALLRGATQRNDNSRSNSNSGGLRGVFEQLLGGAQAGGSSPQRPGGIEGMLGQLLGAGRSSGTNSAAIGGLLAGLLGGRGGIGGAAKGGAVAVLGMVAVNALKQHFGGNQQPTNPVTQLLTGQRQPATPQDEQQLADFAMLLIRAMINAAKADGVVDDREMEKILNSLEQAEADTQDRAEVQNLLRSPMETNQIIAAVGGDLHLAAEVYTASLLAIEVDTDAERTYIRQLGERLALPQAVRDEIHQSIGVSNRL